MISKKLEQRLRDRTTEDLMEIRALVWNELSYREDEFLSAMMKQRFFRTGETT